MADTKKKKPSTKPEPTAPEKVKGVKRDPMSGPKLRKLEGEEK